MNDLGRIIADRMVGTEAFTMLGEDQEFNLLDFWQWSVSDLVSNATRGRLAEYIVAKALGIDTSKAVRDEWDAFDLTSPSGVKVEVKSAAYLQAWRQKKMTSISFGIRATRGWSPDTGRQEAEKARHADVYVFALLAHSDKSTVNPLRLEQWRFYVLPTRCLDRRGRSQHSITLPSLSKFAGPVCFDDLAAEVKRAAAKKESQTLCDRCPS
jgi:hypothetical protein